MIRSCYLIVALVTGCTLGATVVAQMPSELADAIRDRDEARARADAGGWDRLTTDEYVAIMPTGVRTNKTERLTQIRQQTPRPLNPQTDESIRMYSEVAVRRLKSGNQWVLELWARTPQGWRVAESQQTAITQ